jgi:cyanophycinase
MLALVGSGEYLPAIEPLDRDLIGRLQGPPRVACLPTAAGQEGAERISYWSRLGIDHFALLGAQVEAVPVVDRASADDAALAAAIARSNFVYLSGGKPDYLYTTLAGSLAWEAILSVLASGGILAGCSAGAMVLGEKFFGFPGWKPGFNFLPGVTIMPHYDEVPEAMIRVLRALTGKGLTLVGIEANTALLQDGGRYEVLGSGGVTVWAGGNKARYTHGPLPEGVLALQGH